MSQFDLSPIESQLFVPSEQNQLGEYLFKTDLPGVFYLSRKQFNDNRGYYAELARIPELEQQIEQEFVIKQISMSNSKTNVIRGFHAEDWNKLIHIVAGTCLCVLADIRPDSPTFGQTQAFLVGGDHPLAIDGSIFVSRGVANSFLALEGPVNYLYGVDALYSQRDTSNDVAVSLWDPDLGFSWPLPKEDQIFSDRDRDCTTLREKFPQKF